MRQQEGLAYPSATVDQGQRRSAALKQTPQFCRFCFSVDQLSGRHIVTVLSPSLLVN